MNKRIWIIIGIVLVTLGIINAIFYSLTKKPKVVEIPTSPTPIVQENINPGFSETSSLPALTGYVGQEKRGGFDVYEFKTNDPNIQDEILVKGGITLMTKHLLEDTSGQFAPINAFFTRYGEPEKIYFDAQFDRQIYAWPSQGFAVSGTRETNQAFRTYEFPGTTIEGFEDTFASEIKLPSNTGENVGP